MRSITTKLLTFVVMGSLGLVACGEVDDAEQSSNTSQTLNKERARQLSGVDARGQDLCALRGWYGDGVCDDFCANPDRDCAVAYEPCGAKACGELCTICDPNDADCVETAVVKQCGADGACSAQAPMCESTYEPCDGKMVGDSCTQCDPAVRDCVETAVLKFCQADGSCSP